MKKSVKSLISLILTISMIFSVFGAMPVSAIVSTKTFDCGAFTVLYEVMSEWENNRNVNMTIKNTSSSTVVGAPSDFEYYTRRIKKVDGFTVDLRNVSTWSNKLNGELEITDNTSEPIMGWNLKIETNFMLKENDGYKIHSENDGVYVISGKLNNVNIPANSSIRFHIDGEFDEISMISPAPEIDLDNDYEFENDYENKSETGTDASTENNNETENESDIIPQDTFVIGAAYNGGDTWFWHMVNTFLRANLLGFGGQIMTSKEYTTFMLSATRGLLL